MWGGSAEDGTAPEAPWQVVRVRGRAGVKQRRNCVAVEQRAWGVASGSGSGWGGAESSPVMLSLFMDQQKQSSRCGVLRCCKGRNTNGSEESMAYGGPAQNGGGHGRVRSVRRGEGLRVHRGRYAL